MAKRPDAIRDNWSGALWCVIAAAVAFQLVFAYWPVMNSLFHVAPLDTWMGLWVLAASFALLPLLEGEKAVSRKLAGAPARYS